MASRSRASEVFRSVNKAREYSTALLAAYDLTDVFHRPSRSADTVAPAGPAAASQLPLECQREEAVDDAELLLLEQHITEAMELADRLRMIAQGATPEDISVPARALKQSLSELWQLRRGRSTSWIELVHILQACLAVDELETLTALQCEALGRAAKFLENPEITEFELDLAVDDLDANGLDTWAGLSAADPS